MPFPWVSAAVRGDFGWWDADGFRAGGGGGSDAFRRGLLSRSSFGSDSFMRGVAGSSWSGSCRRLVLTRHEEACGTGICAAVR